MPPKINFWKFNSFRNWIQALKDPVAKGLIDKRISEARRTGHMGSSKPVGDGVFEWKFDTGPGYRVYFYRFGHITCFLLAGGDKSTQQADIDKAKAIKRAFEEKRQGANDR